MGYMGGHNLQTTSYGGGGYGEYEYGRPPLSMRRPPPRNDEPDDPVALFLQARQERYEQEQDTYFNHNTQPTPLFSGPTFRGAPQRPQSLRHYVPPTSGMTYPNMRNIDQLKKVNIK